MPLRFSDLPGLMPNPVHYNAQLSDSGFNDMAHRNWLAKQNALELQAKTAMANAQLGAEQEMAMAKLAATQGKDLDEARRKFMERVGAAVQSGDSEAVRSLSLEAPQYRLSIDEKTGTATPADMSQMDEYELAQRGEKTLEQNAEKAQPQFFLNADGNVTPLDVAGAKQRNAERTRQIYAAMGRNARPEDVPATKQAFDTAIAMGMTPEQAMKYAAPETMHERLTRETSERNAEAALKERRAEQGIALGQRGAEHEDEMALRRELADLRAKEAAAREAARGSGQARNWSEEARKMNKELGILDRRAAMQDVGKVLKLLESEPLIPGASPSKAQVIAIGEAAKMAQGGDPRVSDRDRAAVADDWSIVNSVSNLLSQKAYGELNEQTVKNFEEAISRIIVYNDKLQRQSFEDMAIAKMNLPPEAEVQYDRMINTFFNREPWFKEEADKWGIQIDKRLAGPERGKFSQPPSAPSAAQPSEAAPSDDDLSKALEEGGF